MIISGLIFSFICLLIGYFTGLRFFQWVLFHVVWLILNSKHIRHESWPNITASSLGSFFNRWVTTKIDCFDKPRKESFLLVSIRPFFKSLGTPDLKRRPMSRRRKRCQVRYLKNIILFICCRVVLGSSLFSFDFSLPPKIYVFQSRSTFQTRSTLKLALELIPLLLVYFSKYSWNFQDFSEISRIIRIFWFTNIQKTYPN